MERQTLVIDDGPDSERADLPLLLSDFIAPGIDPHEPERALLEHLHRADEGEVRDLPER